MNASEVADFINKFPGFIARVPTAGHVTVESAAWAGSLTYFPKSGKIEASNVKATGDVKQSIKELTEMTEGIATMHILMCGMSSDVIARILVKLA